MESPKNRYQSLSVKYLCRMECRRYAKNLFLLKNKNICGFFHIFGGLLTAAMHQHEPLCTEIVQLLAQGKCS
jgi:hypothetical protein